MEECCICEKTATLLDCGHGVCKKCISSLRTFSCPLCRAPLTGPHITKKILRSIKYRNTWDKNIKEKEDLFHAIFQSILERNIPN